MNQKKDKKKDDEKSKRLIPSIFRSKKKDKNEVPSPVTDTYAMQREIDMRAEQRRRKHEEEDRLDRQRRAQFQAEMEDMDRNNQYERAEAARRFEQEKKETERNRLLQEKERDIQMAERQRQLQEQNEKEARRNEAIYNEERRRRSLELSSKVEERKRMKEEHDREINSIRQEGYRKEQEFMDEQERTRIRRQNEEIEFEEQLRQMNEENKRNREIKEREWRRQVEEQKAQYDYIMKQMEKERWTITIKAKFNARLDVLRSASREIRKHYDDFADSLIVLREYLRDNNLVKHNRYQVLSTNVENLRRVLQTQTETMSKEIGNLQEMHQKFGFAFLLDIEDSLIVVERSCNQMLYQLSSRFNDIDPHYIKSYESLEEMNRLFNSVLEAYSNIPTMDSLEAKHKKGGGSGWGSEQDHSTPRHRSQYHESSSGYYVDES